MIDQIGTPKPEEESVSLKLCWFGGASKYVGMRSQELKPNSLCIPEKTSIPGKCVALSAHGKSASEC